MSMEDEWIYELTHFAKHFRDGGIGCRHVLDLWMFRRAHPDMDESYIEQQLQVLKLAEFHRNVCALAQHWFEDAPANETVELMGEYIFASGSFGDQQSRKQGTALRQSKDSVFGTNAKRAYIWNRLFPPLWLLKSKYTVLQKAPWLLPVIWLIRPFYKLLFERNSLKKQMKEIDAIDDESLNRHRELLKKMGIDYHF